MTALIQRLRKEEKGLTLIELLAVIVIIGIIAAIAIPLIGGVIKDTKENARTATANQLFEAAKLYSIANHNGEIRNSAANTPVKLSDLAGTYIQSGLTDPKDGKALVPDTTTIDLDAYMGGTGTATVVTITIEGGTVLKYTAPMLKDSTKATPTP